MIFFVNTGRLRCVFMLVSLLLAGLAPAGRAAAVRNGNEMALNYSAATGAEKAGIQKQATGTIHTWRYLKIKSITRPTETARSAKLVTVEPSSDMEVVLVTDLKLSLKLAESLQRGDCVAARGRVKSVGAGNPNTIVVDPAVLEYQDKDRPAKGKELLKEVDPRAN